MKRAFSATAVLCLLAFLPLALHGQTPTVISGMAISQFGQPSPFANVRVCLATSSGTPCNPAGVNLYYDFGLTIGAPNPYSADQYGNYSFYATGATTPNVYVVQVSPAPPATGTTFSFLVNGVPPAAGGGGVSPSTVPQPLAFYKLAGTTVNPTTIGSTLGPSYNPGLGPLGTLNSPWTISQRPRVDVTHPNFGTASGCANTADPLGVLDSTCAFRAANTYITTSYGTISTGPFPQFYIPAGHYKLSGAVRISGTYDISGDCKSCSIIEATTANQNIFTIYNDGSNTPNINGYGIRGGIHDLTLFTNLNGTLGAPFNGYTATMLEVGFVPQYTIHDVAFIGGGGRGITLSEGVEEARLQNVYFDGVRWPIVGLGQGAPGSLINVYVNAAGQTATGYNFGSNAVNGVDPGISSTWNPTTVALTSLSVDGLGGVQATVTCTPTPTCLTKGVLGTSSPVAVGNWFVLQGITTSGFTGLNGIFMEVTAVNSAVSGSNFTISSCPLGDTASSICNTAIPSQAQYGGSHTGGTPNYGPDTKVTYTCTSSAGCSTSLLTPTAGTTTSLTGSYFAPVIFPNNAQSAVFGGNSTFEITGLRIDPVWNGVGYQTTAPQKMVMHSFYSESISLHGEPKPNAGIVFGGYVPWTTTTASFSGSTTCSSVAPCTIPVLDTSWFFNYVNDATQVIDITSNWSDMSECPADYNATQSGVASAFVPGVNTNQCENMRGTMAGDGAFHPFIRNESGSTAPANTTWPSGSKVGWTLLSSGNPFNAGNNSGILSNMHNATPASGNAMYVNGCSDQMPMVCASYINGIIYDNTMFWPGGWPQGSYNQPQEMTLEDPVLNAGLLALGGEALGTNCVKITGPGLVTVKNGSPSQQTTEGPLAVNGYFINSASACVIDINYVANGTTVMAGGKVFDSGNQHTVAGANSNTLGSAIFNDDLANVKNTFAGLGTSPIPGVTGLNGKQFSTAYDIQDMGGFNKVASITSWSLSGTTVTFQATNTFAAGDQVVITGLTTGAWMDSAVTNGTFYSVVSPTGSSFQVNLSGLAYIYPYYATSATESGTATYYHSGIRLNIQGGPGNTGTSECVTSDLWNGANWSSFSIFKACAGSTPGASGTFSTPLGVPVTFGDALTVAGPTALNGGFTAAGVVAVGNLSNLAVNSNNFAAGSWSYALGSATATTGQTDPWGGTTATQFVVGSGTVQQVDVYAPNPIVNGTNYNVCAWAKGAAGGEVILFQVSGANSTTTLTTSWNYYCAVLTGTTSFNTRQFSWQTSAAETFYLAGVSTTLATNPPGFLVTGSTQVTAPLTSIAYPFLVATLSANNGTTLPLTDLCTGTASSGKYCDGGGAWTALPANPLPASLTTTAATSDNVTVTGMTSSGHCSGFATNASAATNIATTYVSAKTTNQITVTHVATSGMNFDFICTAN